MDECRIILLLVIMAGAAYSQPRSITGQFFNCKTKGQEDLCYPGTCSMDGLSCDCGNATFIMTVEGIHCVPIADAGNCTNNDVCNGNGTCLRHSNGTDICYCNQLFAGHFCETPRAEVMCENNRMLIDVTPHGNFMGLMFSNGFLPDDPNCVLMDDGLGTWMGNFSLVPGQNTTCGVTQVNGTLGPELVVKVRVLANTNPNLYQATDLLLTFTCAFDSNVTVISTINRVDASDGTLTPGTSVALAVPLSFAIWANGSYLEDGQEVRVGELLTLVITLTVNEVHQFLRVERCTASNKAFDDDDADDRVVLEIVTEGCLVNHAVIAGNMTETMSADGQLGVTFQVYTFMFLDDSSPDFKNNLTFTCDVLLCPKGSNDCDPVMCPADRKYQAGLGRRRRRETPDDMVSVGQTLTVRLNNVEKENPGEDGFIQVTTRDCLDHPHLQMILIGMGVALLALLIALIAVIIFCRRRSRQEKMQEGVESSAFSSSDSPTLHIPRPKLQ